MAGRPQHWKERNGRYSARIVIPPQLRPYLDNRAELEIQLVGDRRTALRNHAAAVASIQRQITDSDQLMLVGVPRKEARRRVQPKIDAMIASWKTQKS